MSPTQAFGVYPAEGTAGDEVSSTYEGRHVTLTAAELLTSDGSGIATKGLPCVFGIAGDFNGVGVCFKTGTTTDLIAIDTEGIWDLSVVATDDDGASLVVGGEQLYINKATGIISKISAPATQLSFGYALGQVTAGNTAVIAVKVHWDPLVDTVLEVRGTPGDGIVFVSVGKSGNPLTYAASGDKAVEVWNKFTLATAGAFYGIESDVSYEPATSGRGTPIGIVGRVHLAANKTFTGGQAAMYAVQGQLDFADGATVNQASSVFAGLRGVMTSSGTPVYTAFDTITGIYIDNLDSKDKAGIGAKGAYLASFQNHGGTLDAALHLRGNNKIGFILSLLTFGGVTPAIGSGAKSGAPVKWLRIELDGVEHFINAYPS